MNSLPKVVLAPDGPTVEGAGPELLGELLVRYEREAARHIGSFDIPAGLPESQVRDALEVLGLACPAELVVLFGWHNGSSPNSTRQFPYSRIPPVPLMFSSVEQCVAAYRGWRDNDAEDRESGFTGGAGPAWFPLSEGFATIAVECSNDAALAPLVKSTTTDTDPPGLPFPTHHVRSLCTLITWQIEGMASGGYSRNANGVWEADFGKLTPLQVRSLVY